MPRHANGSELGRNHAGSRPGFVFMDQVPDPADLDSDPDLVQNVCVIFGFGIGLKNKTYMILNLSLKNNTLCISIIK